MISNISRTLVRGPAGGTRSGITLVVGFRLLKDKDELRRWGWLRSGSSTLRLVPKVILTLSHRVVPCSRMRKYKPVELPLKDVPADLAEEHAVCPNCLDREADVIGRLGLRLVFKCQRCRVRFHRQTAMVGLV